MLFQLESTKIQDRKARTSMEYSDADRNLPGMWSMEITSLSVAE